MIISCTTLWTVCILVLNLLSGNQYAQKEVYHTPVFVNICLLQDLNQYVLLETLDILGDLVHRYGGICNCVDYYCIYM